MERSCNVLWLCGVETFFLLHRCGILATSDLLRQFISRGRPGGSFCDNGDSKRSKSFAPEDRTIIVSFRQDVRDECDGGDGENSMKTNSSSLRNSYQKAALGVTSYLRLLVLTYSSVSSGGQDEHLPQMSPDAGSASSVTFVRDWACPNPAARSHTISGRVHSSSVR